MQVYNYIQYIISIVDTINFFAIKAHKVIEFQSRSYYNSITFHKNVKLFLLFIDKVNKH